MERHSHNHSNSNWISFEQILIFRLARITEKEYAILIVSPDIEDV